MKATIRGLGEQELPEYFRSGGSIYHVIDQKILGICQLEGYEGIFYTTPYFISIDPIGPNEFNSALQKQIDEFVNYLPSDKFDNLKADISVQNQLKNLELNEEE